MVRCRRREPPQDTSFRRCMQRQRASQHVRGEDPVVVHSVVDGCADKGLAIAFDPLCCPQFGPAPATRIGTMQHGTAERTTIHDHVSR
jgi:hypothetical protein